MINKIKYIYLKILTKLLSTKNQARILEVKYGQNPNFGKNHNFGSEPYIIEIGDNFNSASNINFITHDGSIRVLRNLYPEYSKSDLISPIKIGNNVFIGMNVNILPGTKIENNVIVGAGSIVKGRLNSNSVYAGVPAKYICSIDEYLEKNKTNLYETKGLSYFEKKDYFINKTNKKKKIFLIIHQLNNGGSQKVVMNLSKHLNKNKFEVHLVVINKIGEFADFTHPNVNIIDLKSKNIRSSLYTIYKIIKTEKPDIVFSALSYLSLLFSIFMPLIKSKNMKFIARETNTLSISNASLKFTFIRNTLYKLFYKRFDKIICQSEYMQDDLVKNFNIKKEKTQIIYNPVDIESIVTKLDSTVAKRKSNSIKLLAVGRLHKNKGFDLLLQAFELLPNNYTLDILGDGKEKDSLVKQLNSLQSKERVNFLGFKSNPYQYMNNSDLLILSSRHEGLPNVILEANVCKLPVVAFECPGGTKEIVKENLNGFLSPCQNVTELKNKIIKASNTNWNKEEIFNYVNENFDARKIIQQYESVFLNEK